MDYLVEQLLSNRLFTYRIDLVQVCEPLRQDLDDGHERRVLEMRALRIRLFIAVAVAYTYWCVKELVWLRVEALVQVSKLLWDLGQIYAALDQRLAQ